MKKDNEKIEKMISNFIEHGMDLSYFKFQCEDDREQFFSMYIEYFNAVLKPENEFYHHFDEDKNLHVTYEGEEYYLYISDDFETLACNSDDIYFSENEGYTLVLTILFLTVKELKLMIEEFSRMISGKYPDAKDQINKGGKFKSLGEEHNDSAKKIRKMQTSISKKINHAKKLLIIQEIK